jgi:Fe-S-cluster containining protein
VSGRRPRPGAGDRADRDAKLAALRAIYAEVDARFAGWSCEASTDCCHFGRTGREPYVTPIELAAVLRERARSGRKPAADPAPRRANDRKSLPLAKDERRCPLLDDAGRCTVYEARPFGCRTFFCDRALPGDKVAQRDINAFVARIRDLTRDFERGDEEGRPLTRMISR